MKDVCTTTYNNIRLWDGISDAYIDQSSITICNETVTGLGKIDGIVKDMSGLTVIPGLIDSHIHISVDPEHTSIEEFLNEPKEVTIEKMNRRAKRMVDKGITTARDLGGGKWLEIDLRDRILQGEIPGPRLLCAGQPLTTPDGHCHFWGGGVKSQGEIQSVIDRQHRHDVDLIKVMATGGVYTPNTNPGESQFSLNDLSFAVQYAKELGYHVAAHCHGTEGIHRATLAGVKTIEHCSWFNKDGERSHCDLSVIADIVNNNAWVSPTINTEWSRYADRSNAEGQLIRESFRLMRKAGVQFIASTDAGIPNVFHHEFAKGLSMFADLADMTPLEVLKSSTGNAAFALGYADRFGSLRVGLSADFIFVEGDPLRDLKVLQTPALVVARGVEQ